MDNKQKYTEDIIQIDDNLQIKEDTMLSSETRQASAWTQINDYAQWFLGATGEEISKIDSTTYYSYIDGRECLKNESGHFGFAGNIWESKCISIYCEPHLLLFGIYGLKHENQKYSVEQIKEYLGYEVSWGVEFGQDFFQYSFEDIIVRFYTDKEKKTLLENSFILLNDASYENRAILKSTEKPIVLLDSILEKSVWHIINERYAELGKKMSEIDEFKCFRFNSETYYYENIRTGRIYGFGEDDTCDAIVFPAMELFPNYVAPLTLDDLKDYLEVDLMWESYDNDYVFIFDKFLLFLPSDDNRNVDVNSSIVMKMRWW